MCPLITAASTGTHTFFIFMRRFLREGDKRSRECALRGDRQNPKGAPSVQEVQKAKNQIESSFIMGQDSIYLQAMKYGTFEMLGDWRLIDTYLEGIRKVTPQAVMDVAGKYLKEDDLTEGILIPAKKVKSEK